MRCPKCGVENARERRFCAGCGCALAAPCPDCAFQNQPEANFCGGCGARLAAPLGRPMPAAAHGDGERRQVTVLFADLAGFTKLSAALDPEELHGVMSAYFEAADAAVARYGGTVDKHIGDAVMALFGAPRAHGDDPLRAVRAALDIQEAMAAISRRSGHSLEVHSGIACGEVVAGGLGGEGRKDYTVLGDSVNLASRLNALAGPGETLIAEAVYGAVSGAVACEALGEVAVKGLDRPVRAWRARALLGSAPGAARGPFVGRRGELRQFAAILDTCRDHGPGQAVLLRGEAGIGKSRLVEEFAAMAERQGFACHKGLVLDFGVGKGQDAVRALVRSLIEVPPSGGKGARAAAADRAERDGWLEPGQRVFLNDLLDLAQPAELRSVYDAMDNAIRNLGKQRVAARLVEAASAHRPLLVAVEDIHWAERATLAYLAAMASVVPDRPAVLVMTTRVEGDPIDTAWRGATRGSALMTVDLGPLRREEAMALASGFADAGDAAARRCVERAEGNPLFLEQLLRNAEESEDAALPASVQSLVLARMDRLPGGDKLALQAASVVGQRFGLETLRFLVDDPGVSCAGLINQYLVRPEGGDYLFAHALIQQGVYSSLLKSRRRQLHKRAAEWFAGRDPVLYAEHLDRADDPAAPRAYLEGARGQAANHRYERALSMSERGLALAKSAPDKFALTCAKGETLRDLGSIGESVEAYRSALALAHDEAGRCQALIGLAAGMRITDDYEQAFAALDEAEDIAQQGNLPLELAQIHHLRGNLSFPLGRIDACLEEHGKSLAHARRAGSPEAEAQALGGLGDAEYARGRMATAYDYFRRCVALCREHGVGRIEVANLSMVGHTSLFLDGPKSAIEHCHEAVRAAARVGHHRAELNAHLSVFFALVELDRGDETSDSFERARALVERLGARRFDSTVLAWQSRVRLAQGRRTEAVELGRQAFAVSLETGTGFNGPRALSVIALASQDPSERERALAEGESYLDQGSVGHNHLFFYRDAMEVKLAERDWDRTDYYAAALEAFTRPEPLPWSDFFIARGRALAAWGRGRRDAATRDELERLRGEAVRAGLMTAVPTLEAALGGAAPARGVNLP